MTVYIYTYINERLVGISDCKHSHPLFLMQPQEIRVSTSLCMYIYIGTVYINPYLVREMGLVDSFFYYMYVHCLNTRLEQLACFIVAFLFIEYFTAQQPVIALLFSLLKFPCCYIHNLLYSQYCYTPYFYSCWIDIFYVC